MAESAWKRVYFDLPAEVHAALPARAKQQGMAMKTYLANLIINDVKVASVGAKRGKKKGK